MMIYFRKEKPRDYKYPILEYYLHYPASLSIFYPVSMNGFKNNLTVSFYYSRIKTHSIAIEQESWFILWKKDYLIAN